MVGRIVSVIAVVVALLAPASTAMAQPTAEEIAARCIAQVRQISGQTVENIGNSTRRSVERIQELDRRGASNEVIIRFGMQATENVNRIARLGAGRIERVVQHCVGALRRLNAPSELIDSVRMAGRNGIERINTARERGIGAIREAVREATR